MRVHDLDADSHGQQGTQHFGTHELLPGARAHQQHFGRNKQAPRLKELAAAGKTVIQAAKEMGMETKRARLIARENDIKFQGQP